MYSVHFTPFKFSAAGGLINPLPSAKIFTSDFTITVLQSVLIIWINEGHKKHVQLFQVLCDSSVL
jgi:hypothetical protein